MTTNHVFILNGPPGCGKDTLATMLCSRVPALKGEFKAPLYDETARLLEQIAEDMQAPVGDFPIITAEAVRTRNEDRATKEEPWIGGLSVRRWLQITSQMVIKPRYGEGYFGKLAAELWYGKYIHHIIADGGFMEEVNAIVDVFGPNNVHVIRLHRAGFTFEGDTRQYVHGSRAKEYDITLVDGHQMTDVEKIKELFHQACAT